MGIATRLACFAFVLLLLYWYVRLTTNDEDGDNYDSSENGNERPVSTTTSQQQYLTPSGIQKSAQPNGKNVRREEPDVYEESTSITGNNKNNDDGDYSLDDDNDDTNEAGNSFMDVDTQGQDQNYAYDDEDDNNSGSVTATPIDYDASMDAESSVQATIKPPPTAFPTKLQTSKSPTTNVIPSAPIPEDEDADLYDEEGDATVKQSPSDVPVSLDEETLNTLQAKEAPSQEFDTDVLRECKLKRSKHPGVYLGPRVQYVHVPKAGGTSIQDALRTWVSESDGKAWIGTFDGPSTDGSSVKCPARSLDFTVLIGHRGLGFCKDVEESPRGMFIFTAVREPVARIVSMFDYKTETRNNPRVRKAFGAKKGGGKGTNELTSLNDLIKAYNATSEIEPGEARLRFAGSQQARFLCGYDCLGPLAEKGKFSEAHLLSRARKNLQRIDAIGVLERLDELIPQLKLHLTFVPPRITKWPTINVASSSKTKKSVLDEASKEILRNWAWVDRALHKEVDKMARIMHERAVACMKLIRGGRRQ